MVEQQFAHLAPRNYDGESMFTEAIRLLQEGKLKRTRAFRLNFLLEAAREGSISEAQAKSGSYEDFRRAGNIIRVCLIEGLSFEAAAAIDGYKPEEGLRFVNGALKLIHRNSSHDLRQKYPLKQVNFAYVPQERRDKISRSRGGIRKDVRAHMLESGSRDYHVIAKELGLDDQKLRHLAAVVRRNDLKEESTHAKKKRLDEEIKKAPDLERLRQLAPELDVYFVSTHMRHFDSFAVIARRAGLYFTPSKIPDLVQLARSSNIPVISGRQTRGREDTRMRHFTFKAFRLEEMRVFQSDEKFESFRHSRSISHFAGPAGGRLPRISDVNDPEFYRRIVGDLKGLGLSRSQIYKLLRFSPFCVLRLKSGGLLVKAELYPALLNWAESLCKSGKVTDLINK